MKRIVIALVILGLLITGCAEPPVAPSTAPALPTVPVVPAPSEPSESNSIPNPIVLHEEPPENVTWISPGKVHVGNFYPGARAEWDLLIHNGEDRPATFSVTYRKPNYVDKDYWHPPEIAKDWVIIADATPVIMPRETKAVLIVLEIPADAETDIGSANWIPPDWEFWISVIETTQASNIQTELCSRWLVSMRK